tara:strand:+ start:778 stop:951 length:174 start_codon:yes stop_codon:yes gene_type:complete
MTTTTTTELEERSEQFDLHCELHGFEHACRWLMNKVKRNRIDSDAAAAILTACVENH